MENIQQAVGRCLRLFYKRDWFLGSSRGALDAHRGVRLNGAGVIDSSMLDAGGIDHDDLGGLPGGDPHTQYTRNGGRAGGQTVQGGTAANNDLTLESTSHGTKGIVDSLDAFRATSRDVGTPAIRARGAAGQTAPVLQVLDSADTALYQVLPNGQTTLGMYNELSVNLLWFSAAGSGQTLTIDITFSNQANAPYNLEVWIMSGANNSSARAFQQRLGLRQASSVPGTMQILGSSTAFDVSAGSPPTIAGPTQINQGIRYVLTNTGGGTQNRGVLVLKWANRPATVVTVSQVVANL